jgi:hypothetical protein
MTSKVDGYSGVAEGNEGIAGVEGTGGRLMLEHLHMKLEAGLKRRAEQAADSLEVRNLSAFVRMAIAEKVNATLRPAPALPVHVAIKDQH